MKKIWLWSALSLCIFLKSLSVAYAYDEYYDNYNDQSNSDYQGNDLSSYQLSQAANQEFYQQDVQYQQQQVHRHRHRHTAKNINYHPRLPSQIPPPGEKVIIIDPQVHAWGAYTADGVLLRSGLASAGSGWCRDLHRPCRTKVGSFRIFSLGGSGCVSSIFPLGKGGAPMPYCMFFNKNQALHGSYELANANISHGCVRMRVEDAEWLRFNFANIGTKVIVKPY